MIQPEPTIQNLKLNRISTPKTNSIIKDQNTNNYFFNITKKMSTDCFTIISTIVDFALKIIGAIFGFGLTIWGFKITKLSWYKQSELNRENEIAKHRLELLRKTFKYINKDCTILKNSYPNPPTKKEQSYVIKSFNSISEGIYLLGTKEEQEIWDFIMYDFHNNKNINSKNLLTLLELIKCNYRRELGL